MSAAEFDALFYPGGHGPMWDLAIDPTSIALIEAFARAGKPVGAVCHAPAALTNVRDPNGVYLINGRRVTGFSNEEEQAVHLDRLLEQGTQGPELLAQPGPGSCGQPLDLLELERPGLGVVEGQAAGAGGLGRGALAVGQPVGADQAEHERLHPGRMGTGERVRDPEARLDHITTPDLFGELRADQIDLEGLVPEAHRVNGQVLRVRGDAIEDSPKHFPPAEAEEVG